MARYVEAVNSAEIISEKLNVPLGDLVDVFAEIPTADVVEVGHGKWVNVPFTQRYGCSLCGKEIYFGKDKFCNECGARMDDTPKERGKNDVLVESDLDDFVRQGRDKFLF